MSSITASSKSKRKISSVAIYTLGCKLNFSESSYISKSLKENDYEIVDFKDYADAYEHDENEEHARESTDFQELAYLHYA